MKKTSSATSQKRPAASAKRSGARANTTAVTLSTREPRKADAPLDALRSPAVAPLPGLETLTFATLTDVKAKLSEHVRGLRAHERRVVITVEGRPAAVLIAYEEFVPAVRPRPTAGRGRPHREPQDTRTQSPSAVPAQKQAPIRVIDIEDWRRERPAREQVRDSILSLFDVDKLSRKGQKRYKRDTVRAQRP